MHRVLSLAVLAGAMSLLAALGSPVRAATGHGAWALDCPKGTDSCRLVQQVSMAAKGGKTQVVLGVLGDARGKKPYLAFRFSKEAIYQVGIGFKVGAFAPRRYPIYGCDLNLCEARVPITPELLRELRASPVIHFAYFIPPKAQVSLPVSLDGFGPGWRALSARVR